MKKFFALVLAVAMVLSMGSAYASIGWAAAAAPGAAARAGVNIEVTALEYSGTLTGFTWTGLTSAMVWKEITGRVVKDTLVKFPIKITVPAAAAAGLSAFDYVNPVIQVALTNATVWDVMSNTGTSILGSFIVSPNGHTLTANWVVTPAPATHYEFTVLAIVDSTNLVDCTVTFTMGQNLTPAGGAVSFVSGGDVYTATWTPGVSLVVVNTASGGAITFDLDGANRFTSSIWYNDPYVVAGGTPALPGPVPVSYCLQGELTFNGYCNCNKAAWPSGLIATAWYEQIKANFNEILNALGFSFSYGNFNTAYCTVEGLLSLTEQVRASASVKVGGCTELGVGVSTPPVGIPQTGAVSVIGYALVTLAGAALAISRKK